MHQNERDILEFSGFSNNLKPLVSFLMHNISLEAVTKRMKISTNAYNNPTTIFLPQRVSSRQILLLFVPTAQQQQKFIYKVSFWKCKLEENVRKIYGKKKLKTEWILWHFFYCKIIVMCLCNYFALFCKWLWRHLCFSSVFNLSHITENGLWHDKMLENAMLRVFSIKLFFTAWRRSTFLYLNFNLKIKSLQICGILYSGITVESSCKIFIEGRLTKLWPNFYREITRHFTKYFHTATN